MQRRLAIGVLTACAVLGLWARAGAQDAAEQSVLGPGLYVFQTRARDATCGDEERSGYVTSFIAPIDGVPGSRRMRMRTPDSPYWSSWSITVEPDGTVSGVAFLTGSTGPDRPSSRFTVRRDRDRFTGQGVRRYQGTVGGVTRPCEVTYDALLRRIDV